MATEGGNYNVVATDNNGCEVEAVIFDVIAGVGELAEGSSQLAIFPVPALERLYVKDYTLFGLAGEISIYNVTGEKIFPGLSFSEKENSIEVDISKLNAGIYWLELQTREKTVRAKFLKN